MNKQTCCLCCSRRSGVQAIGVLFVVWNVLFLLGAIAGGAVLLATMPRTSNVASVHSREGFGGSLTRTKSITGAETYGVQIDTPLGSVSTPHKVDSVPYGAIGGGLAGGIAFILLCLLFSSLLVHGSRTNSAGMILSWLIFYFIFFLILSLGLVGLLITLSAGFDQPAIAFGTLTAPLLTCCLLWYWWAVVLKHYSQLNQMTDGFRYNRQKNEQHIPMED